VALMSAIRGLAALAINRDAASRIAENVFVDAGNVVVTAPARGVVRWGYPNQSGLTPALVAGTVVEQNQLLCYLNAGLLYLPIRSPVSGVIQDVLPQDHQETCAGEAIVSIRMN
jgi:biotin carboxyl carrier protein